VSVFPDYVVIFDEEVDPSLVYDSGILFLEAFYQN
jgi:hypothetical protein